MRKFGKYIAFNVPPALRRWGLLFLQFVLSLSQIYKKEFQFFPKTPLAQNRCCAMPLFLQTLHII